MTRTEAAIVRAAYAWVAWWGKHFHGVKFGRGTKGRALCDAVLADKRAKRRRKP